MYVYVSVELLILLYQIRKWKQVSMSDGGYRYT